MRRVRLPTLEMGDLEVLLVQSSGGIWEGEWDPLRGTVFGDQFTMISSEVCKHAFNRWTKPLVDALGVPPKGALKKIPELSRKCLKYKKCPLFDSRFCFPESKNMPWCFEPDGVEPEALRLLATQAIELWRQGVYIIVVEG